MSECRLATLLIPLGGRRQRRLEGLSRRAMLRGLARSTALLLAANAGLGSFGPARAAPAQAALPGGSIYRLEARLIDQSGRPFTLASKRGQAQVVVMFYTSCKFICPTIIDTVLDLDRELGPAQRQRLGVLMISLDPQHDDPTALSATADKRGLDLARWTLAQPRVQDLRAIAGVLGVRYRPLSDGEINHTGVLVLLDVDGQIVARSEKTAGSVEPRFLGQVRAELAKRGQDADPPARQAAEGRRPRGP
jgi:protein SCO1